MTDVEAIANHYISITPMHIDLTHENSLIRLKEGLN
jgi:broad specificity polyphosphatase/5'/3'-nucleotidase SurE